MKGLINIKNNDDKCFLWCQIRHLNPLKTHPERIKKAEKKIVNDLDYEGIELPVSKKDYRRIEQRKDICINAFCYENGLTYPVYVSGQKFKDRMDLLIIYTMVMILMLYVMVKKASKAIYPGHYYQASCKISCQHLWSLLWSLSHYNSRHVREFVHCHNYSMGYHKHQSCA